MMSTALLANGPLVAFGCQRLIISEMGLNPKPPAVEGTHDRRTYLEERREASGTWTDRLRGRDAVLNRHAGR